MPTLRFGFPVYESVTARTLGSILNTVSDRDEWTIVRGTWIDKARNEIMDAFDEDYLLMVDSDMVFGARQVRSLVKRLESYPDCGAISGHYILRDGSGRPACDWKLPGDPSLWMGDEDRQGRAEGHTGASELAYVDSFGAGFLAVSQEAKQKVGSPWFKTTQNEHGDFLGEDTFFCQRLQEEGFKPAVDFGVLVGHCGQTVFHPTKGGKEK